MKAYVDYDEYKALKERVEWLDEKLHMRTRALVKRIREHEELKENIKKAYDMGHESGYEDGFKAAIEYLRDAVDEGL